MKILFIIISGLNINKNFQEGERISAGLRRRFWNRGTCGRHAANALAEGAVFCANAVREKQLCGRERNCGFAYRKEIVDFLTEEKFTVLRTEKRLRIFGRKNRRLFGREKDYGFSDGKRNDSFADGKETAVLQTEKETVALRTGKGREFSDRERNGSFADDGRNCGFAGIRGEHACSFADSPDCVYLINNIKT